MKLLIIFFISINAFAQTYNNDDRIDFYVNKAINNVAFSNDDVRYLLDELEPSTGRTILKDVFIPYAVSFIDKVDRKKYILAVDRILEALESALGKSPNDKDALMARFIDAETSLINLINSNKKFTEIGLEPEREYYNDNVTLSRLVYKGRDNRVNKVIEFYEDGITKSYESEFIHSGNDIFSICTNYYPDGKISSLANYKNGKPDGAIIKYNAEGLLIRETVYKEGVLDGVSNLYNQKGDKTFEIIYKDSKKVKITRFFPLIKKAEMISVYNKDTGKLLSKEEYKIDKQTGKPFLYMLTDFIEGIYTEYDPNGHMVNKILYQPTWSKDNINKYSKGPINADDIETLLDRGFIKNLIATARDYKDVLVIHDLLEQLCFIKVNSNIDLSQSQKGLLTELMRDFNKLKALIAEAELNIEASEAKSLILRYTDTSNKSGFELIKILISQLNEELILNDGRLSKEALNVISNKDVIKYLAHYSKDPQLLLMVSRLEMMFISKPELGESLKGNTNLSLKEFKSFIDGVRRFASTNGLIRR